MILKRKVIKQLEAWKADADRKALLIKGARQVGKTTSVRQFAKNNYKHFIEINFEQTPSAKAAFAGDLDARSIILGLSAMGYGPFKKGETLLFLDEIQSCPQARTAVKFIVEDGCLDVIESGSLLGINYKDVSSFPVGYEEPLDMFPLDLEEFLWANSVPQEVIDTAMECYQGKSALPQFLHEQLMNHLRHYLIVGGMPAAVVAFLSNPDFGRVLQVQNSILDGYRNDIAKYAGSGKHLTKAVFDAIPAQLSKADKRFVLSTLEDGASMRKYGNPTEWLVDAGIAYFSCKAGAFELPFALNEKRQLFKLFFLDNGLLAKMGMDGIQFRVMSGDMEINEGALTENFVAAELSKHGKALHYYDRKSKNELDFIIPEDGKITILEVKSGKNYTHHPSLDAAMRDFSPQIARAIVLCRSNVRVEDGIIYYPLYMTMFI